ncbi:hypothetical protein H4R33_001956 [Dimargaris cristalligena]|nr:hypothetical protein H4R33_001956 [Dimargaris cristalligena]
MKLLSLVVLSQALLGYYHFASGASAGHGPVTPINLDAINAPKAATVAATSTTSAPGALERRSWQGVKNWVHGKSANWKLRYGAWKLKRKTNKEIKQNQGTSRRH